MSARGFALAALIVLSGCAVGPDYEPPEPDVAPRFLGEEEGEAAADMAEPVSAWWSTVDDPLLGELVSEAIAANRELLVARANILVARADAGRIGRERYPIVTSSGAVRREKLGQIGLPGGNQYIEVYDGTFDAVWELDFYGRVRRRVEAALADLDRAVELERALAVTVAGEVARSYFELRGNQLRLAVAGRNAENQRQTFELTQALLAGGRGTELDIARARAQLEATRATIPALEADTRDAALRLAVLTGRNPSELPAAWLAPAPLPSAPALVEVGSPVTLLRRRPDVRAAERSLAAATARIGVAVADLYPQVSLTGVFGSIAGDTSDFATEAAQRRSIGAVLSWPAFDLGRTRAGVAIAEADAAAELARFEQAVLIALEEVERDLSRYLRTRLQAQRLDIAAEASREAARLARLRYQNGVDSFLNVLDAESRLLTAEDQAAVSRIRALTSLASLYKSLAGGWELLGDPAAVP